MIFFWIYEYRHTDDDWSWLLKTIFFTGYYFRWRCYCRFNSCFKIFAIIKPCFKNKRGCFHTQAIVVGRAPVCPPTQAKYRVAFPRNIWLPHTTWFARILRSRVLAFHSLRFHICHFPNNMNLGGCGGRSPRGAATDFYPHVLRVSRWETCPCLSHQKVWVILSFLSEQLAKQPRLTLNSCSSCFHFSSAGIWRAPPCPTRLCSFSSDCKVYTRQI